MDIYDYLIKDLKEKNINTMKEAIMHLRKTNVMPHKEVLKYCVNKEYDKKRNKEGKKYVTSVIEIAEEYNITDAKVHNIVYKSRLD